MPLDHRIGTRAMRRGLGWLGLALLLVAIVIVATGLSTRRAQSTVLRDRADALAVPTVLARPAAPSTATPTLALPARIEAWSRAPIYARVSGYLKQWTVDIGSAVTADQLLAEIETPELDQQLLQAQAELNTARTNAAVAATTAARWRALLPSDSVSRQEVEEKSGDLAARQSQVKAAQANVERIQALKRFARIAAPFDGVITARNTDVGALVSVGGAPGSELFVVSDTSRLRAYVNVPQAYVAMLAPGLTATLTVPERPGQTFPARLLSTSRAINAGSGTMLVQLTIDNVGGELLPGGFATVDVDLPRTPGVLAIPPGALIFDKAGLRVATVGPDDKVVLKPVTVARDLGSTIELASGLTPGDLVIENPPDGVQEGDRVQVAVPAVPAVRAVPAAGGAATGLVPGSVQGSMPGSANGPRP